MLDDLRIGDRVKHQRPGRPPWGRPGGNQHRGKGEEKIMKWDSNGHAYDEDRMLGAKVELIDVDPDLPWTWFITSWPIWPDGAPPRIAEEPSGRAATEAEAKLAVEKAMPSVEQMAVIREAAEVAWAADLAEKAESFRHN